MVNKFVGAKLDWTWYDEEIPSDRFLSVLELKEMLSKSKVQWKKDSLNELDEEMKEEEAKVVFILASKPFIAKEIFSRYFLGKSHNTTKKFRYLSYRDQLRGFHRGTVKIVLSSERYYQGWMKELYREIVELAPVYDWEIVYEQDFQKEPKEGDVRIVNRGDYINIGNCYSIPMQKSRKS